MKKTISIIDEQLWRSFWIHKYGYYPDKMVKVARKITLNKQIKKN